MKFSNSERQVNTHSLLVRKLAVLAVAFAMLITSPGMAFMAYATEPAADKQTTAEQSDAPKSEITDETQKSDAATTDEVTEETQTDDAEESNPAESESKLSEQTLEVAEDDYEIVVSGTLPEGAYLEVVEIADDTDDYEDYVKGAAEAVFEEENDLEGDSLPYARFFDITIKDADGNTYEPAEDVVLTIDPKDKDVLKTEDVTFKTLHFKDADTDKASDKADIVLPKAEIVESKIEDKDDKANLKKDEEAREKVLALDVPSFSVYGVVYFYTVDFFYNDAEHHMNGGSEMMMSELFGKLGIEKDVKNIKNVAFTDDSLVSFTKDGDDYKIKSLKPFTTAETLTITFNDGTEIIIAVEDEIAGGTFGADNSLKWSIDDEGHFILEPASGSNGTINYTYASPTEKDGSTPRAGSRLWPWEQYKDKIVTAEIKGEVRTYGLGLPGMFEYCDNLVSVDVSGLNVSRVDSVTYFFANCPKLKTITGLDKWAESVHQGNGTKVGTGAIKNVASMFRNSSSIEEIDLSTWTSNGIMKNFQNMCTGCTSLKKFTLNNENFKTDPGSQWHTGSNGPFKDCNALETVDMSNITVSTNNNGLKEMFTGLSSLKEVTMKDMDFSDVKNMKDMFNNCQSLETLTFAPKKGATIGKVFSDYSQTNMDGFFLNCPKLKTLDITNLDNSGLSYNHQLGFEDLDSLTTLIADNSKVWIDKNGANYTNMENVNMVRDIDFIQNATFEYTPNPVDSGYSGSTPLTIDSAEVIELVVNDGTSKDTIGYTNTNNKGMLSPGTYVRTSDIVDSNMEVPLTFYIIDGMDVHAPVIEFLINGEWKKWDNTKKDYDEGDTLPGSGYLVNTVGSDGKLSTRIFTNALSEEEWDNGTDATDTHKYKGVPIRITYPNSATSINGTKHDVVITINSIEFKNMSRIPNVTDSTYTNYTEDFITTEEITNPWGPSSNRPDKYKVTGYKTQSYPYIDNTKTRRYILNADVGELRFWNQLTRGDVEKDEWADSDITDKYLLSKGSGTYIDFDLNISGAEDGQSVLYWCDDLDMPENESWTMDEVDPNQDVRNAVNYAPGAEGIALGEGNDLSSVTVSNRSYLKLYNYADGTAKDAIETDGSIQGDNDINTTGVANYIVGSRPDPETLKTRFYVKSNAIGSNYIWTTGTSCETTVLKSTSFERADILDVHLNAKAGKTVNAATPQTKLNRTFDFVMEPASDVENVKVGDKTIENKAGAAFPDPIKVKNAGGNVDFGKMTFLSPGANFVDTGKYDPIYGSYKVYIDSNNQKFFYNSDGDCKSWDEEVVTVPGPGDDPDEEKIIYTEKAYTPCVETTKAYVFKISETKGTEAYITEWDETQYYLKVVTIAPATDAELLKGTKMEVTIGTKKKGATEITWGTPTTKYGSDTKDNPLDVNVGAFNNKADEVKLPKGKINVKKILDGRNWTSTDKFTFVLKAKDSDTPMPEDSQEKDGVKQATLDIDTKDTKVDGSIYKDSKGFGEISFTGADLVNASGASVNEKTFQYTITEQVPDDKVPGITYSTETYDVQVTVKNENGELKISKTEIKVGDSVKDIASFTNKYDIKPVKVDPPVKKVVTGTDAKDPFTYTFKPVSNTAGIEVSDMPMPEGSSGGQKQITKEGHGEFEFGEFELSLPGTYVYEITEEKGSLNYDYDSSKYTVTYVVKLNDDKLEATTTITKDGKAADKAVFTNSYLGDAKIDGDETYGIKGEVQTGQPKYDVNPSNPVTPKNLVKPDKEGSTISDDGKTVTIPGEGTYALNSDGSITFTPDKDFVGDPTPVSVEGSDKKGNTVTALYKPHIVDPTDTQDATRTVHFTYESKTGEPVTSDVTQTAPLTRHATKVNPKTGETTEWGPWESATFPAVENPDKEVDVGWITTYKVGELTVNKPGAVADEFVIYHKGPEAEDKVTYGAKGEIQSGTPEFTPGSSVLVKFELINPNTDKPTDRIITDEGTYTINSDTGEVKFEPKDEFVGKATKIKVRGTDANGMHADATYTPHVVNNVEKDEVKRTIEYVYSTGEPAKEDVVQTLEFVRTGKVDPKTGEVSYDGAAWEPVDVETFTAVISPEIENWIPDRKEVGTAKVSGDSDNITEKVIYSPEGITTEPAASVDLKNLEQSGKPTFTPKVRKLPSGEDNTVTVKLIDPESGESVDSVTVKGGTYKLNEDGSITFTPEEGFTGNPDPISVKGTDKLGNEPVTTYTPRVVDPVDTDKATRTVHFKYKDKDGKEVTDDVVQELTLTRHATSLKRDSDGKVITDEDGEPVVDKWDLWEPATFPAVTNPDKEAGAGWTTSDRVSALTVNEPGKVDDKYVVYVKKHYTVTYEDGEHGSSNGGSKDKEYGDTPQGNKVKADKGYKFTGRYKYVITDENGKVIDSGTTDNPKSIEVIGNIVFTPEYEKIIEPEPEPDNDSKTNPKSSGGTATGDYTRIGIWVALIAAAMAAIIFVIIRRRRSE